MHLCVPNTMIAFSKSHLSFFIVGSIYVQVNTLASSKNKMFENIEVGEKHQCFKSKGLPSYLSHNAVVRFFSSTKAYIN